MIFTKDFTIPKNTSKNIPHNDTLVVCRGLIYRIEFQFPAGCAGLAYVAMFDGSHQIYPSSMGEWFHTDNFTIGFDDLLLKLVSPFEFDLYGYNLDETYDHTVYVRIGMVDKDEYIASFMPTVAYEKVLELQGKEAAKQEVERQAIIASPFPWIRKGGWG